ncbi:MAG: DUF4255 domain-containing protein [Desulfobulbaceae bacterium]|nr:DUF4255 domain-containing protein [Desulfobulbaceae bacterium]
MSALPGSSFYGSAPQCAYQTKLVGVFGLLEKPLQFIESSLNNYLRLRNRGTGHDTYLELTDIVDDQGKFAVAQSTVGMSLINIEEEKVNRAQLREVIRGEDGAVGYANPEIRLQLHLLFVANFKDHDDSVKNISAVISFFQSNNVFTPAKHPELDENIEKIVFELGSYGFEQLSYIWGILGTNYRPSVIYKMRLITIQEALQQRGGAIIDKTTFKGKGIL